MIDSPCGVCRKAVSIRHRAIECNLCKTFIHIKCNKFNQTDYKFHQNNPDEHFYCITCIAENIAFSTLNDNQFEVFVKKGINHLLDDVIFKPTIMEQHLFHKLNDAINRNAFDITEEANEDNNDVQIDCKYYSLDEFVSAKLKSSKTFSIVHLNIHSIEKHIEELRVILAMLEFKFDIICL